MPGHSAKLQEVLDIVSTTSAADLAALPQEILQYLMHDLTPEDRLTFQFTKNVKVFGGINAYVDDFFGKDTVGKILAMSAEKRAANIPTILIFLNKMAEYTDLSVANRTRVTDAIAQLSSKTGGGRRSRRRRATRRRATRRRV